tara:strand:+ start:336 stop:1076 length:741 start_codon:yes stop_codon:yes gene_type:complete
VGLKNLLGAVGGVIGAMVGIPVWMGSGIGTLLGGGSMKDAVTAGVLGHVAGPAIADASKGLGLGSLLGGGAAKAVPTAVANATTKGALGGLGSLLTPKNLITASLIGSAFEKPKLVSNAPPDPRRLESSPDYVPTQFAQFPNPYTGEYFKTPEEAQESIRRGRGPILYNQGIMTAADGGFIQGPGTGKSDSIPAMIYQNGGPVQEARLSDGEFVMTADAVKGAGGGNRAAGAAKMYQMMNRLERRA